LNVRSINISEIPLDFNLISICGCEHDERKARGTRKDGRRQGDFMAEEPAPAFQPAPGPLQ
jgi:hypothetical protein